MSEQRDRSAAAAAAMHALLQRAEAYARGDYSALGTPVHGGDEAERLRLALDVLGAHLQHKDADAHDYTAGLIRSQEAERERLSRELHDDIVQRLIAHGQAIDRAILAQAQSEHTGATLAHLRKEVTDLVRGLRGVIADLHPPVLEEVGLAAALRMLFARNNPPEVLFRIDGAERRLDPRAALAVYRIAQEAWSNIQRHAFATTVHVNAVFAADEFRMTIRDDGRGLSSATASALPAEAGSEGGWGLRNMRERAALVGGRLHLISAPNEGTTVFVSMPYVEALARDPVCGMAVSADAITAQHEGVRYAFCSSACRDLFLSQPGRYVRLSAAL